MRWLLCIFGIHKWKQLDKWRALKAEQCERCGKYLYTDSANDSKVTTKDKGLLEQIEWFNYVEKTYGDIEITGYAGIECNKRVNKRVKKGVE